MIQQAATRVAGASRHRVHGTLVRSRAFRRLLVGAGPRGLPVPAVQDHAGDERVGGAVVAIDEEGALVGMAMAGQNEIDTTLLENGQGVLPHLDELRLGVRVVRALAVRRMVPESK